MFDLIVIGGGPAGYIAAERAGHAGLKTLLIEKRNLGGVCLNEGCIPSKALLNSAKIYDYAMHGSDYGVFIEGVRLDHKKVIERKAKVVENLVSGIKAKMKKNKVTVIQAEATILERNSEGIVIEAASQKYVGKQLLIATGSIPVVPGIPGLKQSIENGYTLTNREILDLTEVPEKLAIVGGGVIGLEMAYYYSCAGSKVTVIEMLDHIAGPTDQEISGVLKKSLEKKGILFELEAKVTAIDHATVSYEKQGKVNQLVADKVLLSIGRRAFTDGIGLEKIGVETIRSAIPTDEVGRTNISGVYAVGDVNGKSMLAHTAYREAEVCINHILGKKDRMRYTAIPAVIYTYPEVASVGETEETAKEKGIEVKTIKLPMIYSGRYVAENEKGDGLIKVIVDQKYNRIVGVHMIGSYVSEMIYGAGLMVETELRVEDIKELVFPHPTVCEVIREALFEI
ncbi:MAG: dihydrolipoyl dehydrogenase [Firmicutes bacterium HGW-Firmicutes-1]|jgi:dihydrolipoamide dehydrogenase|nr:MAG: dihydrolipoyl dehydrogenase [Firmicutes bacterium HGW-Firmicutes-1]